MKCSFIAGAAGALAVFVACGGTQEPAPAEPEMSAEPVAQEPAAEPETEPAAEPTPEPEPELTTAQLVEMHVACGEKFLSKEIAQFATCWAPGVKHEAIDSGMPAAATPEAMRAELQMFWSAFPDLQVHPVLTLASGTTVASIALYSGTNSGDMMGMPATNKPVGMISGEIEEWTPHGKLQEHREYNDMATMMGQLGMHKNPHRAAMSDWKAEPITVMAEDSEAEAANVEAVKAAYEMMNQGDMKAMAKALDKNWVFRNQFLPADLKGAKATAHLAAVRKAFPDTNIEVGSIWGAGDYVVAEVTITGTNQGKWPAMGIKKPTGKEITLRVLHFVHFKNGKVDEMWELGNGAALAQQLGLMPAPQATNAAHP